METLLEVRNLTKLSVFVKGYFIDTNYKPSNPLALTYRQAKH